MKYSVVRIQTRNEVAISPNVYMVNGSSCFEITDSNLTKKYAQFLIDNQHSDEKENFIIIQTYEK